MQCIFIYLYLKLNHNNLIIVLIGDKCIYNKQCQANYIYSTCKNFICVCNDGYEFKNNDCEQS